MRLYASDCQTNGANCPSPPNPYCPNGTAQLQGTGFDVWDTIVRRRRRDAMAEHAGAGDGRRGADPPLRPLGRRQSELRLDHARSTTSIRITGSTPVPVQTTPVASPK